MSDDSKSRLLLRGALDRLGTVAAMAGVWLLFAAVVGPRFSSWESTQLILLQTAVIGIAALGATIIIISGGIDLSVGSLIALTSVVVAYVSRTMVGSIGEPPGGASPTWAGVAAAAAGVAVAACCGLGIGGMVVGRIGRVVAVIAGLVAALVVQHRHPDHAGAALVAGALVAAGLWFVDDWLKIKLPLVPFIVTLGTWGAFRGAAKGLANESAIYPQETWLKSLMLPVGAEGSSLWRPWTWWSPGVWIFLALALLVAAILRYTRFGRHVYAIGSSEPTARLCGIDVERTKVKIYVAALLLAGVAGVLQFSTLGVGDSSTAAGYELKVIASVVIGGASLSGGVGGVLGTVAGALMITIIDKGCTKVGMANWVQEIITGAIIVAAVALDQLRLRLVK